MHAVVLQTFEQKVANVRALFEAMTVAFPDLPLLDLPTPASATTNSHSHGGGRSESGMYAQAAAAAAAAQAAAAAGQQLEHQPWTAPAGPDGCLGGCGYGKRVFFLFFFWNYGRVYQFLVNMPCHEL
jgi:hypothetical protein